MTDEVTSGSIADPATKLEISGSIPHRPGLDGLRGVAVAGVIAHHLGYLPGGYLGVDLFFVLSGFLITSLLVAEARGANRISLGAFWARRARRLLPAVTVVLFAVAVWARFGADIADRASLRREGVAGLFYVSNWEQIASGVDYWASYGSQSPLRHLWSLAIEEQFYLVWPLVVALVVWRGGRRWAIAAVATLGVLASEVSRAALFDPNEPTARVYFGTDTRVGAILFGALTACLLARPARARISTSRRTALEVGGLIAAAWLAVAWIALEGTDPRLYQGGLTACGVAAAILIAATAHAQPGPVAAALSWRPLRWLGAISYGLYLWHWPVIAILDEQRMGFGGASLAVLQLILSLALAAASYSLVEQPVRRPRPGHRPLKPWVAVAAASVVLAALITGTAVTDSEAVVLAETRRAVGQVDDIPDELTAPATAVDSATSTSVPASATSTTTVPDPTSIFAPFPEGVEPRVMIVGDSLADSLAGPMQAANGTTGALVLNRALVGCSLINSTTKERTAAGAVFLDNIDCTRWQSVWREGLSQFAPNAAVLILGGSNSNSRWLSGAWHEPCSATVKAWLTERVGDAIDLLATSVDRIAIATTPDTVAPLGGPENHETIACKNDALRSAVEAHPNARLLDLAGWVCPNGTCRTTLGDSDGEPLRRDGLHFTSGEPALAAGRWVVEQLGATVRPS